MAQSNINERSVSTVVIPGDILVWIDLELTDLDLNRGRIIEFALIITDGNLNILEHGPSSVIHQPDEFLDGMTEWCIRSHGASGLTAAVRKSKVFQHNVEQEALDIVRRYASVPRTAILAGNSIHADKKFLDLYMPLLMAHLHYRIVDVSTIKELARRWNPAVFNSAPIKKLCHRALDDIVESIEELRYYRANFFILSPVPSLPSRSLLGEAVAAAAAGSDVGVDISSIGETIASGRSDIERMPGRNRRAWFESGPGKQKRLSMNVRHLPLSDGRMGGCILCFERKVIDSDVNVVEGHVTKKIRKGSDSSYKCSTCDVHLCVRSRTDSTPSCFIRFHTEEVLGPQSLYQSHMLPQQS